MPRGANPFYHNDEALGATLGATLGRALFGDPEAAAQLALRRAQMENYSASADEARAHAGLYNRQGEGVDIQNGAARSLPDLIRSMVAQPQAAPVAPVDPQAPLPGPGQAQPDLSAAAMRPGLPALMAAMAQMKGDKVDPNGVIGGLAAMFGDDEGARRGLIAQGHTPTPAFALTPERADAISARDAGEDKDKAVTTANISASTARRGQDIRSSDTRRGQDIHSTDTRRGQDISSSDRVYATDNKGYDRAGAIALGNSLGTVTSTVRSEQHNRDVGGVANSFHLESRGGRAVDIARRPGVSHAQVVQAYKNAGYTILEQLDEGDHSHVALAGGPGTTGKGAKGAKTPKQMSKASMTMLDAELDKQAEQSGYNISPGARNNMRASAIKLFQQNGNPVDAVGQVFTALKRNMDRRNGQGSQPRAVASGSAPPVKGARQAPDGKWYVQTGKNSDGSPKYARVDG